ncbi:hypothetical protein LJC59_03965 [Desulfovibrio sp. OttesenSCG-928-A18]|nr:hypothetical protein [Desulfovibrio sp. OttesenSCG-928-A18]
MSARIRPSLAVLLLFFFVVPAALAAASGENTLMVNGIAAPKALFASGQAPGKVSEDILAAMLGIPYRIDGAVNEQGQFTLFADQKQRFSSPGLNCSGFVLEASRLLLGHNFSLDAVMRDRLGDSGPGAPDGQDWDFGWDLIMNISEPFARNMLLPGHASMDPAASTGFGPRGFDTNDPATWEELPGRLRPGFLYLASFSAESRRKGYTLQHYHVGLIHVDARGRAWYYHTTGKNSKSNRQDLNSPQGRAAFQKAFSPSKGKRKYMCIIELPLAPRP